jgi:hypothetical protein
MNNRVQVVVIIILNYKWQSHWQFHVSFWSQKFNEPPIYHMCKTRWAVAVLCDSLRGFFCCLPLHPEFVVVFRRIIVPRTKFDEPSWIWISLVNVLLQLWTAMMSFDRVSFYPINQIWGFACSPPFQFYISSFFTFSTPTPTMRDRVSGAGPC